MQEIRHDGQNLQELFMGEDEKAVKKAMDKRLKESKAELIRRISLTNKQAIKFAKGRGVHLSGVNRKPRGRR